MILRMSFEEVTALNSAAERMLAPEGSGSVMAPPEVLSELVTRLPLKGDISVRTLAEQARLLAALDSVVDHLKRRMDALVMEQYVGSDDAVNAYFDYANVLTARSNLVAIGERMEEAIEAMTGREPPADSLRGLVFPD